ncbi:aminotransferase class V-fold PLP-dependent enzyme [Niabella sp. CC-SYL272]|uniref:aminotransferase class V-fold PLP-dependent enzyme n=1 Tax=Niabella agricola TaxID=2891571 RepID=UPI001F3D01C1|nr:aminotransferase class V-fold PLP-dependent enzyme [Niabella agricola]MCF3110267.1 aminotransferase class V-fold PLP-dependent enzyme [Niabella agricola]
MRRRNFLQSTGLLLGGSALLPAFAKDASAPVALNSWDEVRKQFLLNPKYIHMAQMLLASHPKPVRDEIERHRRLFDEDPVLHWEEHFQQIEGQIQRVSATYLHAADPGEVALTDSTSMGLGLLYTGFKLKPGDEILTTTHDHYATEKSLAFAAAKNGASIRNIRLYNEPADASADEIVDAIAKAVNPNTRIVAVTWVHSSTGVKLPIAAIGSAIREINARRNSAHHIYFCVDGVHAFGIENINVQELGCDFLAAGTHKWLFGPRGTGILWGKKEAWDMVIPTIPTFTGLAYPMWAGWVPEAPIPFGDIFTPGGFHPFEHRWSLHKAFEFHLQIGKEKIEQRTHQLSTLLKEGLKSIRHIQLKTPVSPSLSAGINCFEVAGMPHDEVVKRLLRKNIIASSSPYRVQYVRLTPCIINSEAEVKTCLAVLENIRQD